MTLRVEGHSIRTTRLDVCSAISILTENLENSLSLLLHKTPVVKKHEGFFDLEVAGDDEQTDLLVASALLGLRTLSRLHPEAISIESSV